ncbi:hypothetical protein TNIN_174891, partial [Trichonephila inaurata madagascariensis]
MDTYNARATCPQPWGESLSPYNIDVNNKASPKSYGSGLYLEFLKVMGALISHRTIFRHALIIYIFAAAFDKLFYSQ